MNISLDAVVILKKKEDELFKMGNKMGIVNFLPFLFLIFLFIGLVVVVVIVKVLVFFLFMDSLVLVRINLKRKKVHFVIEMDALNNNK